MRFTWILASAIGVLAPMGSAAQAAAVNLPHNVGPAYHLGQPRSNAIVGTWLAVYDTGAVNNYIQWHKDGTATSMASFAPKTGNLLLGDWVKNDDGSDTVFMAGWTYDDKGKNLTGHFTRSETDTVSGNSYTGDFEVTFYDLQGNIVFQHDGTLTATRVGQ